MRAGRDSAWWHAVLAGVCLAGLLAGAGIAWHYRNRALDFERKWRQVAALYRAREAADRDPDNHDAEETGPLPGMDIEIPAQVNEPLPGAGPQEGVTPRPVDVEQGRRDTEGQAGGRRRMEDWIANFRTNDPARYEAMQKRRQEALDRAESAYAGATNYFLYRDTRNMSEAGKEDFLRMLSLMQETRAVIEQMQAGLPPDERRLAISTVRSNLVALTPLLDQERDQEMFDLAISMGHNEAEADRMVAYVKQITSNTSLRVIFPDLPRRGRFEGSSRSRP